MNTATSPLGQLINKRLAEEDKKWWSVIGGQSNYLMAAKAYWLRSAAHYRDPFWRDVAREMNALRNIKRINALLRESITL